jgi:hypothetical protein
MATARTYSPVPLPDVVFETIREIQATGLGDMLDVDNVAEVADVFGDEAQAWIRADRGRYIATHHLRPRRPIHLTRHPPSPANTRRAGAPPSTAGATRFRPGEPHRVGRSEPLRSP